MGFCERLAPAVISPVRREPSVCEPRSRDALLRSLQPTRCHEYPSVFRLPSLVLAHFRSPSHAPSPIRARLHAVGHDPIHADAALPLPENTAPSDAAVGAAATSYDPVPPSRIGAIRLSVECDPRALVRMTREPDGRVADALCRAAVRTHARCAVATVPRALPLAVRQHRAVMSPERLPSKSPQVLDQPSGRPAPWSRHCYADLAAGAQLPTRVHAHAVRARSQAVQLFAGRTPGPREAHRFLQSKQSVSTPRSGPNSDTHAAASRCWSEDGARESDAHRAVSGQGPRAFRSRSRPPPWRPLAKVDLPQPDRPEHPLSRTRVPLGVETPGGTPLR